MYIEQPIMESLVPKPVHNSKRPLDTQAWTTPEDSQKSRISNNCGFIRWGFNYFKLYLGTCCNHCYVYLVKNGLIWLERLFWFILIAISHYASIYIAMKSIDRFMTKNAYMGIERDYFSWNTTLPSLTICPMERLDHERFDAYCE